MVYIRQTIIIHGTGMRGEKFYSKYHDRYQIKFCIDVRERRDFHGLKCINPEAVTNEMIENTTIIILVSNQSYQKVRQLYENKGLKEFEDFIFWEDIDKELAVFYGNCHFHVLKKYLMSNPEFSRRYSVRYHSVFGYNVARDTISDAEKNIVLCS